MSGAAATQDGAGCARSARQDMRPHEIAREAAGLKVWIKLRTEWRQEGRPAYLQAAYADRRREANRYLSWALERLGGLASVW